MKLNEVKSLYPISSSKERLADLAHALTVDKVLPDEITKDDITDEQVQEFERLIGKLEGEYDDSIDSPDGPSEDDIKYFQDKEQEIAAKVLTKGNKQ